MSFCLHKTTAACSENGSYLSFMIIHASLKIKNPLCKASISHDLKHLKNLNARSFEGTLQNCIFYKETYQYFIIYQ